VEVQSSLGSSNLKYGDDVGCEVVEEEIIVDDNGRVSRPGSPTTQLDKRDLMTKTIKRCIPITMESPRYQEGKGMPRTSEQMERSMKRSLNPKSTAHAHRINHLTSHLPGYEHVRTWSRKRVREFLSAYGVSSDGLEVSLSQSRAETKTRNYKNQRHGPPFIVGPYNPSHTLHLSFVSRIPLYFIVAFRVRFRGSV